MMHLKWQTPINIRQKIDNCFIKKSLDRGQ